MSGWRASQGVDIDRAQVLHFEFDGTPMSGYAGDTLASALLASGERVLGRSFKYHRPRGLWGYAGEEPNAIVDVTLDEQHTPNVRATTLALQDGMVLRSVNTRPTAARDRSALIDHLHRFLPAGFYYKTFMQFGWMRWEPMIRRMAGLGTVDADWHPPADTPTQHAHCALLVIGAGPAGLAAARAASAAGRSVWLLDEAHAVGGSLRWRGGDIDGAPWPRFAEQCVDTVCQNGGRVLTDTTCWGAFDHGTYTAWQRRAGAPDRLWCIRADAVIVAAGAIERPLWFANNDLPGVLSAEAALHYLALHGAVAGRAIALATGNDSSYAVAAALASAGATVQLIDARSDTPVAPAGVTHRTGRQVVRAHGARRVEAVTLDDGTRLDVDTVLVSGGHTPSVHLHCQAGGKLDWSDTVDALVPRPFNDHLTVAGAANGTFGLTEALSEGHAAVQGQGAAPRVETVLRRPPFAFRPDAGVPGRVWIDLQNDVTLKDVGLAAQEGFQSVEHLKRYTTLGMATDQGRSSNFAGLAAMASVTRRSIPETGTTTYRPPFVPVPLGVVGGRRRGELFNPLKRLALEPQHRSRGARFREYGGWLRPAVYGSDDETALAQREARMARDHVALIDASPLGKLDVIGPDAAALLDYVNYRRMSTLPAGRARYGFLLGESGVVYDDGVVLRLSDMHFVVSASSSHVDGVRLILEEVRQDRFDPRRVFVHDLTPHYSTLSVSGPEARAVLLESGVSLPEVPHMCVGSGTFREHPLRVARVSFTGDLCFELSIERTHVADLHAALDAAVSARGGGWIGLEALLILRAEKGYVLVGKDTDGGTLPHDLGWSAPRDKRTDEYQGKRSLFTDAAEGPERRQLIGLQVAAGDPPLVTGAHLVPLGGARRSLGFVTSSVMSPTLQRPVALAQLERGAARHGERVGVFHLDSVREATVVSACAFDPEGGRLDG
ncbi:MAG: 2Fe-2S iron-sulfur cluster-binding protein [Pseudomonadota bacterium]